MCMTSDADRVSYQPLLVDELLRIFAAQAVHQLGVIPKVTTYKLAEHCGPPPCFGWRDRRPWRVRDPALQNGPGEGVSAAWRQEMESYWSSTSALAEYGHLHPKQQNQLISLPLFKSLEKMETKLDN